MSLRARCLSVVDTITKVIAKIDSFVRTDQYARSELDPISSDLTSIKAALKSLAEAAQAQPIPKHSEKLISLTIANLNMAAKHLVNYIERYGRDWWDSKRWEAFGKPELHLFRAGIGSYKTSLQAALHILSLYVSTPFS